MCTHHLPVLLDNHWPGGHSAAPLYRYIERLRATSNQISSRLEGLVNEFSFLTTADELQSKIRDILQDFHSEDWQDASPPPKKLTSTDNNPLDEDTLNHYEAETFAPFVSGDLCSLSPSTMDILLSPCTKPDLMSIVDPNKDQPHDVINQWFDEVEKHNSQATSTPVELSCKVFTAAPNFRRIPMPPVEEEIIPLDIRNPPIPLNEDWHQNQQVPSDESQSSAQYQLFDISTTLSPDVFAPQQHAQFQESYNLAQPRQRVQTNQSSHVNYCTHESNGKTYAPPPVYINCGHGNAS